MSNAVRSETSSAGAGESANPSPGMATEPCGACGKVTNGQNWRVFDHEYKLSYRACYHECGDCGTLTQSPMPTLEQLAAFYPPGYHSFSPGNKLMQARTGMRVTRLRKVLGATPGAILDYGCGGGMFLLEAAKQLPDRQFYGYEIDGTNSVTEHLGGRVKIYRGEAEAIFNDLPPLAVACLNHVIEHLPDPAAILSRIWNHLAPGGALDGQTPRADSLERNLFGAQWAGFHAPRHTVVFSKSGIKQIFARCGFDQVDVTDAFNPGGIAISLGSVMQGKRPGSIRRSGLGWLSLVGAATALAPIDLLSGRGGIMDFCARKSS